MKKIMIILLLITCYYFKINAGEISETGLRIGYNISKFIGNDTPGKSVRNIPGFTLGGSVTYKINEKFSFQPEILLATKGSFINTIGDIEQVNVFVYLEMPLLAKIKFLPEAKINPFIFCGPALSMNALAMNSVGVLDNINGFDLGLIIGSGLSYHRISFDIRYERGLINFDNSAEDIDLKNQTISFLFGIAFYTSGGN